jgi:hypothetical protein
MPNLENFLGKENPDEYNDWEIIQGTYGCQQCDKDVSYALSNPNKPELLWICPEKHETRLNFE